MIQIHVDINHHRLVLRFFGLQIANVWLSSWSVLSIIMQMYLQFHYGVSTIDVLKGLLWIECCVVGCSKQGWFGMVYCQLSQLLGQHLPKIQRFSTEELVQTPPRTLGIPFYSHHLWCQPQPASAHDKKILWWWPQWPTMSIKQLPALRFVVSWQHFHYWIALNSEDTKDPKTQISIGDINYKSKQNQPIKFRYRSHCKQSTNK